MGQIKLLPGLPLLQKTRLGWVVSGGCARPCGSALIASRVPSSASKENIFVANRVAAIQELTDVTAWRYVPTASNPADILSRGSLPSEPSESSLWAHGPAYLTEPERDWPTAVCPDKTIISHYHESDLHAGPRALLGASRSQYGPIGGRKTVTKAVNRCIRCFRIKPRLIEHIMADLSKERL